MHARRGDFILFGWVFGPVDARETCFGPGVVAATYTAISSVRVPFNPLVSVLLRSRGSIRCWYNYLVGSSDTFSQAGAYRVCYIMPYANLQDIGCVRAWGYDTHHICMLAFSVAVSATLLTSGDGVARP